MIKIPCGDKHYWMDGYLKSNLDDAKRIVRDDWDFLLTVDGAVGCLAGDTLVRVSRGTDTRLYCVNNYTIKDLYKIWDGTPRYIRSYKGWDGIGLHRIIDVFHRGKKEVYTLTLENEKTIKATADHKFFTLEGWTALDKLSLDDEVMCDMGFMQRPYYSGVKSVVYSGIEDTYDIECETPHHNFAANEIIAHNSGKSVLTQQMAYYCSDGNFSVDDIVFTGHDFRERVLQSKPYSAIVFDEAFRGLSARGSMTDTNKMLLGLLNEIRQKRLFVFIVLPSVWDLDKYVTMHRSMGLIHVHTVKKKKPNGEFERERGHFRFYNQSKLRYLLGNSTAKYVYPKTVSFFGTYKPFYVVDEEEYRVKKGEALGMVGVSDVKARRITEHRLILMKHLKTLGVSTPEIARLLGVVPDTARNWLRGE